MRSDARMSFLSELFATTDVEKLRELGKRKILRRALTAKDLIAIGLGTMIGGGIFTTIGTGVKGAGPAVIVSYLLAGLTSFFAALCYAELGAMVPVAGSAYTYAYATMGKLFAWIIGFALIFEYGISAAPVAQQFSAAIQDVVKGTGFVLPEWAQQSNLIVHGAWWLPSSWDLAHSQYDLVAALFVIGLSVLLSVGIRESATVNNVFVVLKISALIVFVIAGLFLVHAANLHNFNPVGWGTLRPFGGARRLFVVRAAVRHHRDRRLRLLQLHRLRHRDDDRRRVQASAVRRTGRSDRRAGDRHGHLLRYRDRARRRGAVESSADQESAGLRARAAAHAGTQLGDHHRRSGRHDERRAGLAARSVADLLRDGSRRHAAAGRRCGPSAFQDAVVTTLITGVASRSSRSSSRSTTCSTS